MCWCKGNQFLDEARRSNALLVSNERNNVGLPCADAEGGAVVQRVVSGFVWFDFDWHQRWFWLIEAQAEVDEDGHGEAAEDDREDH